MNVLPLLRLLTSLFFCFLTPSESTPDFWDGPFSMQNSIAPPAKSVRWDPKDFLGYQVSLYPAGEASRSALSPSQSNFNPLQSCP